MKRETLVIRPEKHKRRIGVLPTYAQRDRTKYSRKAKHRGRDGGRQDGSAGALDQRASSQTSYNKFTQPVEQSPRKR